MRIAFDAKRAFHNGTGLGHYSRTLLSSLATYFPENQYLLLNPKAGSYFEQAAGNLQEVLPAGPFDRLFNGLWRSRFCTRDLKKMKADLYHGLSHEIPFGMERTGIPSVVTMHDLIPERYPEQYAALDIKIYHKKFRHACDKADRIIAISQQTKEDIIHYYHTDPKKIRVCPQSCDPAFANPISQEEKQRIKLKYGLPDRFFLSVGSIIERKNLLSVCKALTLLKPPFDLPLVVIGNGGSYKRKVQAYIREHQLQHKVVFLSEDIRFNNDEGFKKATDFPAIYQQASLLIYPSFFEGFGIPVLEGLWSKLPVITSSISSLPEAGGKGAYYVNPNNSEEMALGMQRILEDTQLANTLRAAGWEHAQEFTIEKTATRVMDVYRELIV